MPITLTTPEVKLSGMASVERVCSNCKKPWKENVKIEGTAKGDGSFFGPNEKELKKVKEKAHQDLMSAEEFKKKDVDSHVLCPSCNHFSTGAMAKHFPNGYQAGLKRKYIKALWFALLFIPLYGLGAVLIGVLVLDASPKDWKGYWFLIIPFAILALLLVWGLIHNLVNGSRVLFGINRVNKYLQTANDDDLLNLAVSLYKKNKDSLWGFMCWAQMLLDRSKLK